MRNGRENHPYLKGVEFWEPIIAEWVASANYSEKAKDYFRESLTAMLKDRSTLTRQEIIQSGINETLRR